MLKILSLVLITLMLSSCSYFAIHKRDIEQGNVFTEQMTRKLHRGMTQSEVKEIMGSPVLINTFADNRIDYVYTLKLANKEGSEKMLTLTFRQGLLKEIDEQEYHPF